MSRWLWFAPAVIYMGLIFWGSSRVEAQTPLAWGISDKLLHVGEYTVLGLLVFAALRKGAHTELTVTAAVVVAWNALYGISDEVHQLFTPTRGFDLRDWSADIIGGFLAVFLSLVLVRLYRGWLNWTPSSHLRVLVFAAFYPPETGGYAKNVRELAQRVSDIGHSVVVVTCGKSTAVCRDGPVVVVRLSAIPFFHGRYPVPKLAVKNVALLVTLSRMSFDIVNTQTRFFVTTMLGVAFAKLCDVRLVHTERGSTHNLAFSGVLGWAGQVLDHTAGMAVMKAADKVIGVSGAACRFAGHLGAKDAVVVHNGVDVSKFGVDGNRNLHGVVFVGRLIPAKGVDDLLTAFAAVRLVMPDTSLTIVGDGSYRKELENRAVSGVVFTGEKSGGDVAKILSENAVFVNPSYSEGLPTTVMEAMAAGMAVVATDVGGTAELIVNGETGYLVPSHCTSRLAGAMVRALADADGVGVKAREKAAEFGWDGCVRKTVAVYQAVLKQNLR